MEGCLSNIVFHVSHKEKAGMAVELWNAMLQKGLGSFILGDHIRVLRYKTLPCSPISIRDRSQFLK
ncbi:hypothetical protein MUK42_37690 [Musa troglodytarum]|uniref:Uncharacterized protein n=1 Tax=Musa troglodytarum TaxID=320322 RepID=A0A9E7GAM4_9LILI|nr:hypothetical protein MUK42_37690 [Musa troglodytarum]